MKRRSFLQLALALAGLPFLPKAAAKRPSILDFKPLDLGEIKPVVPVGTIQAFVGALPNGWLPCDGRMVSENDYPELWKAIGTPGLLFQLPQLNANALNYGNQLVNSSHSHSIVDPGHSHGAERYMKMQYIIKT